MHLVLGHENGSVFGSETDGRGSLRYLVRDSRVLYGTGLIYTSSEWWASRE